ncbi:hypothetical protein M513_12951 [Trichuris suis]|uniref:G-protein coupled receptors family 1 profile domain-containing protein n=1 Tax=Trichuris suis TaxID=68888 RepID=A0A085LMI1_9BILA|nr:hypothetical protein M513_12951 [Trichuris suis]
MTFVDGEQNVIKGVIFGNLICTCSILTSDLRRAVLRMFTDNETESMVQPTPQSKIKCWTRAVEVTLRSEGYILIFTMMLLLSMERLLMFGNMRWHRFVFSTSHKRYWYIFCGVILISKIVVDWVTAQEQFGAGLEPICIYFSTPSQTEDIVIIAEIVVMIISLMGQIYSLILYRYRCDRAEGLEKMRLLRERRTTNGIVVASIIVFFSEILPWTLNLALQQCSPCMNMRILFISVRYLGLLFCAFLSIFIHPDIQEGVTQLIVYPVWKRIGRSCYKKNHPVYLGT